MSGELAFILIVGSTALVAYGLLSFLPTGRGSVVFTAAFAFVAIMLFYSFATEQPASRYVDLGPLFRSMYAGIVAGGVIGATGYHALRRNRGHSWAWRFVFLLVGTVAGAALLQVSGVPS